MSAWNFASVFASIARIWPRELALVHGNRHVTWEEFDARAGRLVRALRAAGLARGGVVAEYMPNRPEYLETFLGAVKGGFVPMNTNYRYVDDELLQVWRDADVDAVVFDAAFADRIERVRPQMPSVKAWIQVDASVGVGDEVMSYESLMADQSQVGDEAADDSLVLIFTGGTTGLPKGVMWRQDDLLSMLNSLNRKPLPDRSDPESIDATISGRKPGMRTLVSSPLMHGAGLFYALSALVAGGTLVTLPGTKFDPERLLDTIVSERVRLLSIVGDAFARPLLNCLDEDPSRWDLSGLRAISSSGVMWSDSVKTGLLRHAPHLTLIDGLGSSEASAVGWSQSKDGDVSGTGYFAPSDRAAVLHDDGTFASPGDGRIGKLAVTGWLPLGYLNDPEKTAEVFVEAGGRRWSLPGDFAELVEDGHIRLWGRGSSCINTGGEKVFPEEVEEVLKQHPAIADAAVVGVADVRFGQSVVALVEPAGATLPTEVIHAHARERLAGYKVPKLISAVDSVNRAANGKLDHKQLAEVAARVWSTSGA